MHERQPGHRAGGAEGSSARGRAQWAPLPPVRSAESGNTAAASVPICLHEALMDGRIKDGDLVLLAVFGTGLSWGSTLLRW